MYPLLSESSLLNSALISLSPCKEISLFQFYILSQNMPCHRASVYLERKQKLSVKSTEIFDQIIFETLIGMKNESYFCFSSFMRKFLIPRGVLF